MVKSLPYGSAGDGKIYQLKPTYSKPSRFKAKGWTDSTLGYLNEAKKLAMCLLRNRKAMSHPYAWAVHINLNVELPPKTVTCLWAAACRTLRRRGIDAFWVREPNRSNKVHYHLIVKNAIDKKDLERAIEEAMPDRKQVKWRKRIERIENEWFYARYIVKAKVAGHVKGRRVEDLYARKRLLFKANLKLEKYGVVGEFWERPKKTLWAEIREREKRIADGLEKPNVERLARYVYEEWLGPSPGLTLKQVERSFGYWADSEATQRWIEDVFGQ